MEATAFLTLLLLFYGTSGGPVNWQYQRDSYGESSGSQDCSTHCTGTTNFLYEVGKTYQYQYEATTLTSMHGVMEGAAGIDVRATVSISSLSKCEMLLSLSDVIISSSQPDQKNMQPVEDLRFKSALESNSLRFSFQDGRVEELCPGGKEETMSLNFKRGILSAFQNSMNQHDRDESLKEVDVTGVCPTEYVVAQKGWKSLQFTKTKDLLGCSDRHDYRTSLQTTPFHLPDAIQSLPLLKGNHRCTQTLSKEDILQSSTCTESLVFRPFSKQEAGARTETTQKLTYTRTTTDSPKPKGPISSKTTLLFEHKETLDSSDQTLWSASQKLTELCRITEQDIPPEVPGLFADLVYLMRGLDSKQLLDIADRVQRGSICEDIKKKAQKFFQDALPMVGTSSSIEVMTKMLVSQEITGTQADIWITSLHFVQRPMVDMLAHLKDLLLSEPLRVSALLPVTTLVNNLCRSQPSCWTIVGDIVDILNDILGNDCQSVEQDLVLLTLRAIGNLGYSDSLASTLEKCVKNTVNPINTRVTAVQAYRGISCNSDRKMLIGVFQNTDEDSELRIAAYLAIMQCWDESTLSQIRKTLEKEEVNQVGSFVWTHLTNLMETSSVHKQALKDILLDESLQKEFNMDRRKYSRNYETSFFSEKFGTGAMAESNIIWSSKSFLPRSAMVNLTIDLLGHSVNLFEIGGRVQGLETLIQNYFGADGVFKGGEKPKDSVPSQCIKKEKMEAMKKKLSYDKDEPTGSLYLRMFGNEIGFYHFNEKELASLKNKFSGKDLLANLAKGYDISYTQSALFLDSSVSVPTIAGLSLTLSINGTSTVELIASGKMDLRKFSLKKMEAKFDIRPSGAVQLSGIMSLNAGITKAGLKMVTTLHTSTSASGSFDLTNGQVLNLDLDTPKGTMDILDVKSEFFLISNKAEKKQEVTKNQKVTRMSCTPESVLKVLGYELCGAVSFINATTDDNAPYFPFTGPVTLGVTLHKKDAPKGFRLLGKLIQNKATAIGQLSFDTPGSFIERAINIGYFLDTQVKTAEVELNSPWKKILAKGSYTTEPKTRKLVANLLDDGREYIVQLQLDEDKQIGKTVYTPSLEISRPLDSKVLSKAPKKLTVEGTVSVEDDHSDLSGVISIKSGLDPDAIEVKANYVNKEKQNTLSGSLTLNQKKVYSATFQVLKNIAKGKAVSGKVEPTILISAPSGRPFLFSGSIDFKQDKLLKSNIKITMDTILKEPISLDVKITKQKKKGLDRYVSDASLVSQFATFKGKGTIDTSSDMKNKKVPIFGNKIVLDYNLLFLANKALRKNKVTFISKVLDKSTAALQKYEANINVDSKNYQDASFITNFELSRKEAYTKAVIALKHGPKAKFTEDKTHELRLELSVDHKLKEDSADIKYGLQVLYPIENIEYEIKGKHEHQLKNKFFFETYTAVVFAKGKSVELRVIGNNNKKSDQKNLDASGSLELNFPSFEVDGRKYNSRSYKLTTSIIQNADKEYIHTINLQINDDDKHTLVTKFKKPSDDHFNFYSQLQVAGDSPLKLTLVASRDVENLKGSAEFFMSDNIYSGSLSSKSIGSNYQTHSWDFVWPERRVKGSLEAGKKEEQNFSMRLETFWDADRDPTQKILFDGHYFYEFGKKIQKSDFGFVVTTPFENHKIYSYKRLSDLTVKEVKDEFQVIWQKPENELSYSIWLLLPPSLERFEIKTKIVTPLQKLQRVAFDVIHKFDGSRYLSSSVKGAFNDDEMTVTVQIANTGDKVRNNLDTSFTIVSTLPKYRNVILKLRHNDDGRVYSTELLYEKNAEQFKAALDATYFRVQYQVQVDSKLELSLPSEKPIIIKWVHSNTLTNLNSTVLFNWKPGYDTKFDVGVKVNKAEKDYAVHLTLSGPWKEFKGLEFQFRHNMMIDISGSYFLRINNDPKLTIRATYKYTDSEITYDVFSGDNRGSLKVRFANYPYTVFYEEAWQSTENRWEEKKIIFDASLDKSYSDGWSANAKLVTPWEVTKNVILRGNLQKTSQSKWKMDGVLTVGVRKHITVDFNVDTAKWDEMNGVIKTPYTEINSINFGFSRKETEKTYNSEVFLEMQPIFNKVRLGQSTSLEQDFTARYFIEIPDTEIKFLEINVNHAEQRRGYITKVKVNYHPEKEISLNFNGKFNKNKFPENTKITLDLASTVDVLPGLKFVGELDKDQGKWIGLIDLRSTAKEFDYLKVKMVHATTKSSCYSDYTIESSLAETIDLGMHFDWGDLAATNLTLRAPSVGRTMIGFKQNSKSWTDFQNKVFVEFDGYDLDMDVGLKHDENITKFWLLYSYPGSEDSYLKTSIHRIGNSAQDFDVGGFLQVGKNSRPYNISMQYALVDFKTALGTTLETPFTKALSYLVKNEKQPNGENIIVLYGKYGKGYLTDSFLSWRITDKTFGINSKNEFIFEGKSRRLGTTLSSIWSTNEQDATLEVYYNDDWAKAQMSRKAVITSDSQGTENFDLLVFTPYENYKDIGMHSVINIDSNNYKGSCSLEYKDNNEAVLTFDLIQPNNNEANLEAILTLPIENYKTNTLSYRHTRRSDQLTATGEIITGKGEHLSGKFEFKNNADYELIIRGPIEQFDSLVLSGKYNEFEKKVNGNARLLLTLNQKPITLDYDIQTKTQPITMNFKLRSPFKNVQNTELIIQHDGEDWKLFKTKATLKSESTVSLISETTWRFSSVTNMEGKTTLSSYMKNIENLKLDFSTKDSNNGQKSYFKVGWHSDKEIVLNNTWSLDKSGPKITFATTLDMSTPFNDIKTASIKLAHSHSDVMFSENVALSHNDHMYLDTDLSYQYGGRSKGIVEIRSPRPMSLVVTGSATKELMDGTVDLKWDKRSPEAQIEIVTSLADRSEYPNIDKEFKFKAIHPVRIMGVECLYKKANNVILSSGLFTWDEQNGNTFSYDLAWLNRTSLYSQMHEGHVKLGVPQRSIKVQGSYSDTGSSLTTSSAVWWDADRDDKKKVTMSTNVENKENLKRVGLNINLPSINKQLNLDGTTRAGYGSIISDSRAEISYSSDPRKLIVVTSKISNSEINSPKDYNYTMDIGFEHAITDINMKLSSHLASVGKTCSVGSRLVFLTANKEEKNLAFWAKLDKAQRNMEVKVVTPIKTVGIEGQLDNLSNQQRLLLKSFEDDKQALKLHALVDPRRRSLDIEFNYDQDDLNKMVKFTGHYVNDSALRVDMISQDGKQTTSESMIAVRLNTSHILHTRILWRPTLLNKMQTFVSTKVTAFSYAANEAFSKSVESTGSEVKAKYLLVSKELDSEMAQVFQLMDKEMESLSAQLETLKVEFRRFYQRNDLHIRDMGEQLKSALNVLHAQTQEFVKNYQAYSASIKKATNDWLLNLKSYPIAQKYVKAIEQLVTGLKNLRQLMEEALDDIAVELNKFSAVSYKHYREITRSIDRKLNSYTRTLYELPIYHKMMEQKLYLEKLGAGKLPDWIHIYNTVYLKGHQMIQDQFHDMMSRPEFKNIHAVASEVHQQVMAWSQEQTMNAAVQRVIDLSKNLLLMELMKLKNYIIDMENSRVIVFDPERGELQFEIHLPIPLKSLADAPEIKVDKYVNNMKNLIKANLPSTNFSIWDTYYDYAPSLEATTYLPPFEASAYLIGGQHYITFDEHQYDFLSTCSHVLTRNVINDNFSVVVNYEQRPPYPGVKSLCFNVETLNFEISRDYKLEVNSRPTEMPFITDRVKIVREGDFIRVEYAGGLEVLCNAKLELYKVTVKGWHHGQVAGLLGKYDNEAVNDRMTNQIAQDYEVNRRSCLSKNVAVKPNPAIDVDSICTQIFAESISKFRPCFKQVDPTDFVNLCQIYMGRMPENDAIHLVTEQYRYVCQGHGVFIGPLNDYVPCNSEKPFVVDGTDPLYQNADVLFVVEDNICNQWASTSLASMVTEVNNALIDAGFKNNRFGLQGYGGIDSADISARTINGKHFGEASTFLKAVETLRLPNNTDPGDLASAVKSAMAYPYRTGVAKVLIIVPCSSCEVSFMERTLASTLKSFGFSVHVLQQQGYNYEENSNTPRKYRIYGVDNKRIFSNPNLPVTVKVNDVKVDRVRDYCVTLSEATNGSVFDTTHLNENSHLQKEFIQTFANRVGWGTKLPPCQNCKCDVESGLFECQLCDAGLIYSYLPWKTPGIIQAFGSLHDFDHDVKTYFGYAK